MCWVAFWFDRNNMSIPAYICRVCLTIFPNHLAASILRRTSPSALFSLCVVIQSMPPSSSRTFLLLPKPSTSK